MAITLSTAARNAACNAVVDLIDAGSGAGNLKLYNSGETDLLCEITLNDPAFGDAAAGVATLDAGSGLSGTGESGVSANAVVGKFCDSDDNVVLEVDVGATGSGAVIELDSVTIVDGATVTITSGTFTMPAS